MENINSKEKINDLYILVSNKQFEKGEELDVCLDLMEYDEETKTALEKAFRTALDKKVTLNIKVKAEEIRFTTSNMEFFIELEYQMQKVSPKASLNFTESFEETYTLNQVLNAQQQLNKFLEGIKKLDASPFEKYLLIHDYITSRVYKDNGTNASSRDIISIMNSDNIVCVGYSKLLEYACNEVGIKCIVNVCNVDQKDGKGFVGHRNNFVYIDDPKYGIKGWYYADPCFDAVKKGHEKDLRYTYAFLPMHEVPKHFKGGFSPFSEVSRFMLYGDDSELNHLNQYSLDGFGNGINGVIDQLNLEQEAIEIEKCVRFLALEETRRVEACDKLLEILKQMNIPEDYFANIYDGNDKFDTLVAKMMLGEKEESIKQFITELSKLPKSENSSTFIPNVYEKLQELKQSKNKREMVFIPPEVEKKHQELIESYLERDEFLPSEVEDQFYQDNSDKIIYSETEEIVEWLSIITKMDYLLKEEFVTQYLKSQEYGEAIPLDTFRKALMRAYELKGMTKAEAKKAVEAAITESAEQADGHFDHNAESCFMKEFLRRQAQPRN